MTVQKQNPAYRLTYWLY